MWAVFVYVPLRIGAQAHLEKFYGELGFVCASEPYDEDAIPHIELPPLATKGASRPL